MYCPPRCLQTLGLTSGAVAIASFVIPSPGLATPILDSFTGATEGLRLDAALSPLATTTLEPGFLTAQNSFQADSQADNYQANTDPATALTEAQALLPVAGNWTAPTSLDPSAVASPNTLAQVRPGQDQPSWEFAVQPMLLVPTKIRTEVSAGGATASATVGLGDILNLDRAFAGALRFEARQPRYGFFADLSHVFVREGRSVTGFPLPPAVAGAITQQAPPGVIVPPGTPTDVGLTVTGRTTTFDLGGYYRVVDQYLGETSTNQPTYPRLLVDPYLGLRIAHLSGDLNFDVSLGPVTVNDLPLSESATLIKPLLGAQVGLELSDRWALGLRGNLAGLGIGAEENLAWSLRAGGRYRVTDILALQLAYEYKESRYRAGQFSLNQFQQGFWAGFDLSF